MPRAPERVSPDTPETHQSAMAPYFAVAAAAFELNSVAAVFRFALSAKVCPVQAGGGEGGGGGEGDGGGDALAVINIVFCQLLSLDCYINRERKKCTGEVPPRPMCPTFTNSEKSQMCVEVSK